MTVTQSWPLIRRVAIPLLLMTLLLASPSIIGLAVFRRIDLAGAREFYGGIFAFGLLLEVAAFASLLIVGVLREWVFRVDATVKVRPEHQVLQTITQPLILLVALVIALSGVTMPGPSALVYLSMLAMVVLILMGTYAMRLSARRAGRPTLWLRLEEWHGRRWSEAPPSERRVTLGRLERAQQRLRLASPRVARWTVSHGVARVGRWQLAGFALMTIFGPVMLAWGGKPAWAAALAVVLGPAIVWLRFRLERWYALRSLDELARFAGRVRAKLAHLPLVRVLVLTTTPVETVSVLDAVATANGIRPERDQDGTSVVWRLGAIGAHEILLAQSVEPGSGGPGGAMLVADEVLQAKRAEVVILAGAAHGLQPGAQNLAEVVVARRLIAVGAGGVNVPPSVLLLDRANAATVGWAGRVHFGTVLSSDPHLVNEMDRLRARYPEAIALETSGVGVYAVAARRLRTAWIVIQAVAGWGPRPPHDERAAAKAAAEFVVHVLRECELSSALSASGDTG